ncbi:MAG: hypothetical protein WAR57_08350, partial [Candidatus Phosphoribacter sp.]
VRAWFGEGPGADAADAAGMRGALLAELPVTAGTLQRSAARDLIANLITRAGRPVEQWGEPEGDLVASLGDAVRDPLVAQALMERMPPTLLASFVARLRAHIASVSGEGHGWRTQFDDALNTLGAAFVTVTAQRPWEFLDTAAAAWMRSWQHRWFDHLRRTGPSIVGDRLDDPPFRGFTALGVLLDHAGGSVPGVTPGVAFARTVGLAMVDADRISDDYPPQPRLPAVQGSGAEGVDVMAALLSSLRGAPDAASALLLGRLGNGQLVVHYLAGERLTRGVGGPAPPAAEALAAVLAVTATGCDEQSVSIAGAALDGFGHAAETAGGILGGGDAVLAFEQQLQGLRYVMADLLSVHPDAIWTTINDPVNAPSWLSAPGDEQPWAILGTGGWTVRVLNRSRLAAVIGELGKDRLVPGLATAGPPTAPAMAHLLNSVIASETARLAEALSTGDLDERHAGIIRLGQVTGFVLEAARAGVIAVQERADVSAAERQALVDRIASSLSLPATLRKSIPTALAGRTLDLVRKAVIWVGYGDTTVGSAARAELNAGAVHARLESELRSLGWELVSTSGWWDPADDPLAWVQAHPGVSFCSADGRPLPLASMTAEQRERFLTWSQDVPAFTTVPSAIVAEVQEGARAVRTAIAAR